MTTTRVALILPGRMLGPHVPLLEYAAAAAAARGAEVVHLNWPGHPDLVELPSDPAGWVNHVVREAVEGCRRAHPGAHLVAVAKSLSTTAAPVLADLQVPAVLLTPVLTEALPFADPRPVLTAVDRARVPVLLVGGTADKLWDGAAARSVTDHVFEVTGADHAMQVDGPLAASAAVLGEVATAIEEFLDSQVWHE